LRLVSALFFNTLGDGDEVEPGNDFVEFVGTPEFSGELLERFPLPLDRRRKIVLLQIRPCDKHVSGVIEGVGVDVECLELADT